MGEGVLPMFYVWPDIWVGGSQAEPPSNEGPNRVDRIDPNGAVALLESACFGGS